VRRSGVVKLTNPTAISDPAPEASWHDMMATRHWPLRNSPKPVQFRIAANRGAHHWALLLHFVRHVLVLSPSPALLGLALGLLSSAHHQLTSTSLARSTQSQ
jgi:hypothetical protein